MTLPFKMSVWHSASLVKSDLFRTKVGTEWKSYDSVINTVEILHLEEAKQSGNYK